jgi:methionyl-tRNA formyltransferase
VRTVYIGTSEFAAAVLDRLVASPHRPALVVTRPDRPRGRGRRLQAPPVAETARAHEIDVIQPESINTPEARAAIAAAATDTACVCAYGALIKEPLLSDLRLLNVHPSLLPRWRGAAPVERAIMAGDEQTGVSIMVLTAGLDSGPVCLQAAEPVRAEDDYGSLSTRLRTLGAELLVRALDEDPACLPQPEDGVTYAEKIASEDRRLDPDRPAAELARQVRALTPHVGAYVEVGAGGRLGVAQARTLPALAGLRAGELSTAGSRPVLGCAEGALELIVVQPPGKRQMGGEDYLRGLRG